jgi:nucleoside-diphosphate-sugar epimerase
MTTKLATIVGGRGFIGSALTAELKSQHWKCQIIGRLDPISKFNYLGTVFYCAGHTADYLKEPLATVTSHITALAEILYARKFDKLVYCSSTRLYDDLPASEAARETLVLPIDSQKARHFYDLTKLTGESLCHSTARDGVHVVRLSSVYSEVSGTDGFLGPLLQLVGNAKRGDTLNVASSPNIIRDYIHLSDVVRGLIAVAERGCSPTYNLASGASLKNADLAQILGERTGVELCFTSRHEGSVFPQIDVSLLREEVGVSPETVESALDAWLTAIAKREK